MTNGIGHTHEARSNNFILQIGLDKTLTFAAQTANVADITLGTAPFYTREKELKVSGNTINQSPLIVDVVVSEDFNEWIILYKWILRMKNRVGSHLENTNVISLITLDSQNQPSAQFIYEDAFPTELAGIQYSINEDGSRVMILSVTFEFNRFKVITKSGEEINESFA